MIFKIPTTWQGINCKEAYERIINAPDKNPSEQVNQDLTNSIILPKGFNNISLATA